MSIEFEDEDTLKKSFVMNISAKEKSKRSFGSFLMRLHIVKTPDQASYVLVGISILLILAAITISWFQLKPQKPGMLRFNVLVPQSIRDSMTKH